MKEQNYGIEPTEIILASSCDKASLETVLSQFEALKSDSEDDCEEDGIWFESMSGHLWYITDLKIEWLN